MSCCGHRGFTAGSCFQSVDNNIRTRINADRSVPRRRGGFLLTCRMTGMCKSLVSPQTGSTVHFLHLMEWPCVPQTPHFVPSPTLSPYTLCCQLLAGSQSLGSLTGSLSFLLGCFVELAPLGLLCLPLWLYQWGGDRSFALVVTEQIYDWANSKVYYYLSLNTTWSG